MLCIRVRGRKIPRIASRKTEAEESRDQGLYILLFFFFSKFLEKLFVSWDDGTDFPLHFDDKKYNVEIGKWKKDRET